MKYSESLLRTMKEIPSNCEVPSHILMYRTGMVKQESAGLFTYLPYFNMILHKVEDAIREGMDELGIQEVKFPILVSKELLDESGRWTAFGREMFSLEDRHDNLYALSPTNEEAAAMIAKQYVNSFRDLPLKVYQINTKHRDEIRPKGIGRTRAFTMKDAYTFHTDEQDLDRVYQDIVKGYIDIFKNLGLEAFPVNADNGTMGGSGSQEIMVVSDEGEDEVARCNVCGYAGNLEVVPVLDIDVEISDKKGNFSEVHTPNVATIEELAGFFDTDVKNLVKSVVYKTDNDDIIVAVLRGDRDVNEVKIRDLVGAHSVELAAPEDLEEINTIAGYVGPMNLGEKAKIIVDNEVKALEDFIIGANKKDYHLKDVNIKDFDDFEFGDIRMAVEGDRHECGGTLDMVKAIELGHCFKLGDRYTDKLNVTYSDSNNKQQIMTMGSYGIGLERTVSAIIDKYHDENGIAWPIPLAPIVVNIIPINNKFNDIAEEIYTGLKKEKVKVLFDDRKARPGVKFKDSDLLGIPLKVIIGKSYNDEGKVEIEFRDGQKEKVAVDDLNGRILEIIDEATKEFYQD